MNAPTSSCRSTVTVTTGSRLHFGLLGFGEAHQRQFGGVGMMVDRPQNRIVIEPARRFDVRGYDRARARRIVQTWCDHGQRALPPCQLSIDRVVPPHTGLGSGTQLALAVAAGLARFCGLPGENLRSLCASVNRAKRSSVGSHGFVRGGLIYEPGKSAEDRVAPIRERLAIPTDWRIVQIRPQQIRGRFDRAEQAAFRKLPAMPPCTTTRMIDIIEQQMLPAARSAQLEEFGESVYEYGRLAGSAFASQQGGTYASQLLAGWVKQIRRRGINGVAQSSWGPTLFALLDGHIAAEQFVEWFSRDVEPDRDDVVLLISAPFNDGARQDVESSLANPRNSVRVGNTRHETLSKDTGRWPN